MKHILTLYFLTVSVLFSATVAVAPDGTGISNPAFRAAVLNGSGVSETELGHLDGLQGNIQEQIDDKVIQGDFDDGLALKAGIAGQGIVDTAAFRTAIGLGNLANVAQYSASNPPGWSVITSKPTTLDGYGITDARPLNTGIAVISASGVEAVYPFAAATGAGRWTKFAEANAALTANAGQIVYCPPGDYLHPGTSVSLVAGTTYVFGNARFYLGANASTNVYLINAPTGSADVKIKGGVFDSNGFSVSTGYGWFQANQTRRFSLVGSKFVNTLGAWAITTQSNLNPKFPGTEVRDCDFYNSSGLQILSEFCEVSHCTFTSGASSAVNYVASYGGNSHFSNCEFLGLVGGKVIEFFNYSNDSHSTFDACVFAHNTAEIIKIPNSVDNGVILNGCQVYGQSSTQGWLDLGGAGFVMNGGTMDCIVKASVTPSGNHYFNRVLRPSASLVVTDEEVVSNLDAAKNAKIFFDMYRLDGSFPYNDPMPVSAYTVATLPAASSATYGTCAVSDASSPVVGSTVSGGGAAKALVTSNGTSWTVTAIP